MQYKVIEPTEYRRVAEIHQFAFPDFFLSSLGLKFLETYYKASLKNIETVAIGAYNEKNEIVGFSIGCQRSLGYHKRLVMRNFLLFFYRGVTLFFTKPNSLIRLVRNFDKNSNSADDGEYAELLSLGVLGYLKGKGIGRELVQVFENNLIYRKCSKVTLTTDVQSNNAVLEFYKKNGYSIFYEFMTYPNRRMYKMIKYI